MKNKELVMNLWTQIDETQRHHNAVMAAVSYLHNSHSYSQKSFSDDIIVALIKKELDLWRQLFMFALTLPGADQERVKAAAYDRFLNEQMSVSSYMNNCRGGSSWSVAEDEEFREMVRNTFKPREGAEQ